MNVTFTRRCLSMLLVLVMLFTMTPTTIIAEEVHDHTHEADSTIVTGSDILAAVEVAPLAVSVSASANYVYAGEGAVAVTAKLSGGMAPYTVTLQAVKDGSVVFTDSRTTESDSVKLSYAPAAWGDYELVVTVRDALSNQELTTVALAVAEHDMENEAAWAASVSGASVSSDWGRSLVSVAKTQVGYAESEKDFVLKSGEKQGYSRYGAWYGTPYAGWNNAFIAFVAEYAKVPNDALLSGSSYRSWVNGMSAKGAYMKDDYTPKAGDIAFLSGSRAAIVESVSGSSVTVIEGDVNGAVVRKSYAISKVAGFGNTGLMMGIHNGTATVVPTAAPEATKAPEGGEAPVATPEPTATPVPTPVPEVEDLVFQATPTPGAGVNTAPKEDSDPLTNIGSAMDQLIGEMDAAATAIPMQFSEAYYLMQAELTALVEKYLGTATPTKAEIKAFVDGLELQELYYASIEFAELNDFAKSIGLTEYEARALYETEMQSEFATLVMDRLQSLVGSRGEVSILDGQIVATDSLSQISASGTTITAYATAQGYGLGNTQTNNITIKNNAGFPATVTFNYQVSGKGTGDGATYGTTELGTEQYTYSALMQNEQTLSFSVYAWGKSGQNTTLTFSNFSVEPLSGTDLTINFNETMGSVKVGDVAVNNGDTTKVESAGATLTATAQSGYYFVGWVNAADNTVISTSASYAFASAEAAMTLTALFADAPLAVWDADGKVYVDLNEAVAVAASGGKKVVLANTGTLIAGNYTIPSGVTLLIPFDDAYTVYTTAPGIEYDANGDSSYTRPTAFRTLTMADGAKITVNGALSVSAKQSAKSAYNGSPTGPVGFINMAQNSNITVENGGALYAWGYIIGSGSVDLKSGSVAYEDFQVKGWRGGDITSTMANDADHSVFPMTQFYVQNVEVPMNIYAGANVNAYMSVTITLAGVQGAAVPFVGTSAGSALFVISSGYATKDYIESTGRLKVSVQGGVTISAISVSMKLAVIGSTTINSSEFVLGIPGHFTVDIQSGTATVGQDLGLLGGSEFYVRKGATVKLNSSQAVYVYDLDDWLYTYTDDGLGNGYVYGASPSKNYIALSYAPGSPSGSNPAGVDRLKDALIQIDGYIDASAGAVYTTAGGANVCSTGTGRVKVAAGSETVTQQMVQTGSDGKTRVYVDIPINPAWLKNADGSYTETGVKPSNLYTKADNGYAAVQSGDGVYAYVDGVWVMYCDGDSHIYTKVDYPATCEAPYTSVYTCRCGTMTESVASTAENLQALGHLYADGAAECGDRECQREGCDHVESGNGQHTFSATYTCVARTCTVCGTEVAGDGNHTELTKTVTEATCEAAGYTTNTCACGHTFTSDETAAKGHDWQNADHADNKAATCTADGQQYQVCNNDSAHTQTVVLTKLGHDMDMGTQPIPGTCVKEEYQLFSCQRTSCGYTEEKPTGAGYGDHTWEDAGLEVQPTCVADGYQPQKCRLCDATQNAPTGKPATGEHDYPNITFDAAVLKEVKDENGVVVGYAKLDCTVGGTVTKLCSVCGHDASITIDAEAHTEVTVTGTAATCTTPGKEDGKKCSVCGVTTVEGAVIPAGHTYKYEVIAPTCTAAGYTKVTCEKCDYTNTQDPKDATGHAYVEDNTHAQYKAPTCEENGVKVLVCGNANCPEPVKTETITKLGHKYADTQVIQPTCMTAGYTVQTCENGCGSTQHVNEVPASDEYHNYQVVKGYDATCTATGLTDGEQCSICHEWKTPQEVISAKTHAWQNAEHADNKASTCVEEGDQYQVCANDAAHTQWVKVPVLDHSAVHEQKDGKMATCLEDGYTSYTYCPECEIEIGKNPIEKSDAYHTIVEVTKQDKTCTQDGWEAYEYCSVCGSADVPADKVIPAGHDIVEVAAQAKTCTEAGWNAYEYCTSCTYTTKVEIPAGHDIVEVAAQAKTCTEAGWNAYEYCTSCTYTTKVEIPAGHDIVKVAAQAKTCTEAGWNAYEYCESCTYTTKVEIPAGHDIVEVAAQAKTCTEAGWNAYEYCESCTYTTKVEIPAGHDIVEVAAQAKTCTEAGWNAYEYCESCTYTTKVEIPAGHELKDGEAKAVTCTEDGWAAYKYCTECEYTTKSVITAFHQKEVAITEAVASTCQEKGYAIGSVKCESCNEWVEGKYTRLPLVSCSFTVETDSKAADCTEDGYILKACVYNCGQTETTTIPALKHQWDREGAVSGWETTKEASCYETGVLTWTCECGEEKTDVIPLEDHTYNGGEAVNGKAVKNTETGVWETCSGEDEILYTCTVCPADATGHTKTDAAVAVDHAWQYEEADPATCMKPGVASSQTCTRCNEEQGGGEIPAQGHLWSAPYNVVDATCLVDGHYTRKCEREGCDADVAPAVETVVIEAKGEHTWGEWSVKTASTCKVQGVEERSCTLCADGYETRDLALADHQYESVVTAPTCKAEGYTTHTCKVCDHEYTDSETAKLDHVPQVVQAVAPTCGSTGSTMGTKCTECGDWITEPEVVAALKHKYNDGVITTQPTCVDKGVKTFTCTQPGCTADIEGHSYTEEVAANGHSYKSVVTAPTCNEGGYTTHTCTVCEEGTEGHIVVDSETEKLGHSYKSVVTAPTCNEGGYTTHTCTVCEEGTEGHSYVDGETEKLGHSYKTEVTAPTCNEGGYTTHTCTVCEEGTEGHSFVDSETEKLGHSYKTEVTAPTCTADGYTTYTCTVCEEGTEGHSVTGDKTTKLGHAPITLPAKAPTCTENGLTAGTGCSRCDHIILAQTVVAANGHDYVTVSGKDATCTETGLTAGEQCSVCQDWKTEQTVIPANGHTDTTVAGFAATCTAAGKSDGVQCSVCKTWITAQTVIPATGHDEEILPAVAPTCTDTGKEEGKKCTVCGIITVAQKEIAAKGHTEVEIPAVAPTCTEAGSTAGVKCSVCQTVLTAPTAQAAKGHTEVTVKGYEATCDKAGLSDGVQCSVCETWITAQTEITAKGHTEVVIDAVAATCEKAGKTAGKYCSVCETVLEAQTDIPATGHTEVTDAAVEATCTKPGLTEGKHCSVCKATILAQETIDALGHEEVVDAAVAPTCTEPGLTEGKHCSVCNTTLTAQNTVNALGHKEVVDAAVAPTCTATGLTEGKHCSVCEEVLLAQEVVDALGHEDAVDAAVAPTCTETGLTEGKHCSVCEEVLLAQEVVAALGHKEAVDAAVAPTCTETGLTEGKHCSVCEEVLLAQETVEATGHEMDEGQVTKEHTCTEAGVLTYTCINGCGHTTTEDIPAKHIPEVIPAVAPTCTETGLSEGSICSVCEEVLVEQQVVAASHTWETVKVYAEADCTNIGRKDVRCTVDGCGVTDTIIEPALGHTVVIDPAKAPTCTTDGISEGKHCAVCKAVLQAQVVIEAAHAWNAAPCQGVGAVCPLCGETNTELLEHNMAPATCAEPSTCKYGCGHKVGEPLGHKNVEIEAIPVMCEEPGWTSGTQCSVCGKLTDPPREIPAVGHDMEHFEAKKATFTSAGWYAYDACSRCALSDKVEIPALGEQTISTYSDFMKYLPYLEQFAVEYAKTNPGTDPVALVIKYIRTGVDRYNSGSWGIMAGYENTGFAKYVGEQEDLLNADIELVEDMIKVSGLKNLENFTLPNGNKTDIGHMFGTMDITYHNNGSVNHADVGGWAGDLVDLLSTADHTDHVDVIASAEGDFEKLVSAIRYELLGKSFDHGDVFSQTDIYGDLDAFYVMDNLDTEHYAAGDMTALFDSYFTTSLDDKFRAGYLLEHRLDGVSTRSAVREAVYSAYTANNVINTLEGTRDFNASDLTELRQASCYAFADFLCQLAGDYVDVTENPYLTVFQSEYANLAPGISMETHYAKSADNKQMVYYLAYGAVGRDDVTVIASYNERHVTQWKMARVLDQANTVQELYSNPENKDLYTDVSVNEAKLFQENFNVITAINGAGFNMGTGEPGGLLVMHGKQYHAIDGNGFFGMHKDGYAVIGTTDEYNTKYKGQIEEAIAGFGTMLVKDGEIAITAESDYYSNRASRTAVGITATGRVVFMVLDGRQEPRSCGGSMIEIAQIMRNAGCVQAINLDGGGSTTFVARQAGSDELAVCNNPSDGVSRSVSTGLMMISTAPSSTAFDHALVKSQYNNLTKGASVQMEATGVSATGNVVDLPEGTTWAVSDTTKGVITEEGIFTALAGEGTVDVQLMLGETTLGQKTLNLVIPDQLYFTKEKIDSVYGSSVALPLKASYEGKDVAFTAEDIVFTLSTEEAGQMDGLNFVAAAESNIITVNVVATLEANPNVSAAIDIILYKQGENSFDFDQATGGSRILAWQREVSNSYTADDSVYYIVNPDEDMVTTYAIALDMTQIPIPQRLEDLTYMLPGSDIEGACAWTFLLQLAERISVLTTVTPKITFDPNFDVDYSEIKLINDYFTLDEKMFDEETNTLTLTLHWIDQTAAIDPATANPLCMVTGLKVTPKEDAAWNDKDQLKPVHYGDVSYKIYMRASGLYSFSQKKENQDVFGLYPFVNPNDESEKGGYFQDTYTNFEDSYTLVRTLKNGWYNEDGGFVYYVNGVRNIGIQEVDGLYYDFGANGVNNGKKTYTGLHVMNGYTYYIQLGAITKGWNMVDGAWYYFDSAGRGVNGTIGNGVKGVTFECENGRLLSGCWLEDSKGRQYYYGPEHYYAGWKVIDGEEYFFKKYYVVTGVAPVHQSHDLVDYWYEFTDDGKKIGLAEDGLYWYEGERYLVLDAVHTPAGLYYYEGDYYCRRTSGILVRGRSYWVGEDRLNGLPMSIGTYLFDENGRMIMEPTITNEDGSLYYYNNGYRVNSAGVVEVDGYYYYVSSGGLVRTNQVYIIASNKTNGLIPSGTYRIDENGHILMDTAVAPNADGKLSYYKDGKLTKNAGLVLVGGEYYYVNSDGTVVTSADAKVTKHNYLLPSGTYTFDESGKMILERVPGDADGDGKVTMDDVLRIMEYDSKGNVVINARNAEVTTDDVVSITDALLIMQYISGWDVTLE